MEFTVQYDTGCCIFGASPGQRFSCNEADWYLSVVLSRILHTASKKWYCKGVDISGLAILFTLVISSNYNLD